ncbi:MAG TPA: CZB domain-containing protein, partial [Aquabacterium sp.]|nr:CZB domain-containing protein [Aquabacterium sp.]
EIATGAREQSQGVSQIVASISELDHSTQANAALVEETAAAAQSMKDMAQVLAAEATRFELPHGYQGQTDGGDQQGAAVVTDFDFQAVIEAHRQWKVKLRSAIDKHEQLDAALISRDDCCTLGKWLHGPGGACWGQRPAFVSLVQRHATFHEAAGAVARKINAGAYQEAERLIGAGSPFAEASTEVGMALTQAKRGL